MCRQRKIDLKMAAAYDSKHFVDGGVIKTSALGRPFEIGTLYDYRTDTIIEGKNFQLVFPY